MCPRSSSDPAGVTAARRPPLAERRPAGTLDRARACIGLALLAVAAVCQDARAEERIVSFVSDIEVQADGAMTVSETIRVIAEGQRIKRGIYRDFPTRYTTLQGQDYVVDFELIDVRRDGTAEPHHSTRTSDGVRVYIGSEDVYLNPGQYTYRLTYRTDRQLGFFEDHDELYWNVTGNDWAFPIGRAAARVVLPASVPADSVSVEGYTGPTGSRGRDFRAVVDDSGVSTFHTTRELRPGEGLTVVVGWPKGHVSEPTLADRFGYFLRDNRVAVIGLVGLGVLLAYYLIVWFRVGRDPQPGTIAPLFHPPDDLSPAAVRYIYRMGFDNKAYSAAVINMAVKGYLTIEDHDDTYKVRRVDGADETALSRGEAKVAASLFGSSKTATFERKHNATIRRSVKALKTLLRNDYHKEQFRDNVWYLAPGIALSVLILAIAGFNAAETAMMGVWLAGWSFAVFMLIIQRQRLMAAIFVIFELVAVSTFFTQGSWPFLALVIVLVALNALFYYLVKAPTDTGRKLMDRIEGFKLYLATAEEDRLNALNPPEQTPELFEKYLPYALALGVDQAWSERFAAVLRAEAAAGRPGYRPGWYSGRRWNSLDPAAFSSGVGASLSSAVARSSVAPGSSSGGGGGGSSGGGGGGGGGGGW